MIWCMQQLYFVCRTLGSVPASYLHKFFRPLCIPHCSYIRNHQPCCCIPRSHHSQIFPQCTRRHLDWKKTAGILVHVQNCHKWTDQNGCLSNYHQDERCLSWYAYVYIIAMYHLWFYTYLCTFLPCIGDDTKIPHIYTLYFTTTDRSGWW